MSRDVHPAVLNDGAEILAPDTGDGGGAVDDDDTALAEAQPPEDPIVFDEPTDAQPTLLLVVVG